ncbi:MAG: hypothetical protein JSS40_12920 [Proteobacteria bacterium]|nr:hypothetical protein [Pseudomonadota bacterium]
MRRLLLVACLCSGAAGAQERDVQRALMLRQQQSDEFSLQLRQSQQRLQVAPGDLNQQQDLEGRQLQERQRLESLGAQQQRSIGQESGNPVTQRQQFDRDRQMELQRPFELRLPPPRVREPVTPRPKDPEPY